MININNTINNMTESIVLNDMTLFDFYLDYYNDFYDNRTAKWKKNVKVKTLINLFENICLSNNRKFRFLSIIQHNILAFKMLMEESEILLNDEEITEYFNVMRKNDDYFLDFRINLNSDIHKIQDDFEDTYQDLLHEFKILKYRIDDLEKSKKGY